MNHHENSANDENASLPGMPEAELAESAAWEMIEPGRYQPRRIRGSHRGRELG